MNVPTEGLTTRGVRRPKVIAGHQSSAFVDKHYEILQELGAGASGAVCLVKDKKSGDERVCKRVSLKDMGQDKIDLMKREVDLLCQLDHPHVVKIFEYAIDEGKNELVLILERLCGGDVFEFLQDNNGTMEEALAAKLVMQTLRGLRYCHLKGIVHRDIKPENIMLTGKPKDASSQDTCKIIDFGVATHPDAERRGLFGTPSYMAPEVAVYVIKQKSSKAKDYTTQADLWSLGVTAFVLLTGRNPFDVSENDYKVVQAVLDFVDLSSVRAQVARDPTSPRLSREAWDFCQRLIAKDPLKRLTAEEALEHPWLQKYTAATPLQAFGSNHVLQSFRAYEEAPAIVRCCLFLIVARQKVPDLERLGETFLRLDKDGNGRLSKEELEEGMGDVTQTVDGVDEPCNVEFIMRAADLDHSGDLDFSEFAAACLYISYSSNGSLDELMEHTFAALDEDRDGHLSLDDVLPMFRERDAASFSMLPTDRKFDMFEWVSCLRHAAAHGVANSLQMDVKHVGPPQLVTEVIDNKVEEASEASALEPSAPAGEAGKPSGAVEQRSRSTSISTYSDPATTKYSYEALQSAKPEDVHPARKHLYLSDEEFQSLFGMMQGEFEKLPIWKQQLMKKARGLY
mmetsp:Transcript_17647/g.40860  ORF Transcript_17647/g.40860 Transcript_17647/m.40860 type:complete len:625 (+) Transcript_17647:115-1989(+)